jgi:hypothetical protein
MIRLGRGQSEAGLGFFIATDSVWHRGDRQRWWGAGGPFLATLRVRALKSTLSPLATTYIAKIVDGGLV